MYVRWGLAIGWLSLIALGCGREELPFTDNSQDTELYVQSVRELIEVHCKEALAGDPTLPVGHLYQELERTDRPVGSYEEVFEKLRPLCREAFQLIRSKPNQRPDLKTQLNEMIELASELPKMDEPAVRPPQEREISGS